MRGEFIGVWSETWREIWLPLIDHEDVPEDIFCELYRALAPALKIKPSVEALADVIDSPVQSRERGFRLPGSVTRPITFHQGEWSPMRSTVRAPGRRPDGSQPGRLGTARPAGGREVDSRKGLCGWQISSRRIAADGLAASNRLQCCCKPVWHSGGGMAGVSQFQLHRRGL